MGNLVITKGVFEEKAFFAYIDLCGVRSRYKDKEITTEDKAVEILEALLIEFAEVYKDYYSDDLSEFERFNINIYGDSIVICCRPGYQIECDKMIDFLQSYQVRLLYAHKIASRALMDIDAFFYFRVEKSGFKSVLTTEHTTISLCGGHGLVSMDSALKGLPMGVYVSSKLRERCNVSSQVKTSDPELFFVRQNPKIAENVFHKIVNVESMNYLVERNEQINEADIESALKRTGYKAELYLAT